MPESTVFLFANASNVSRIKAEVALSAYISERDKKRFCNSPEAYCRTDVDFSVSIYSENQLINKSLEGIGKSSKSSNDLDITTTIMIDEPPGCSANITDDKNESVAINDNCDSKDEVIWKVGQKFTSIELVEACKTNYELKRHCQLVKSKVRSLEAAKKRISKRIALANMALHYQTLQFVCKFSGKSSQPELERKRKTKSFRCGCPFEIVLELSVDNQHLQVVRVQEEHNHLVSQELYKHLPKQTTLSPDMMKNVKEAIQLKANSKHLQQKIELSSGKKCILKDIANLRQYSKVSFSDK
ncbi:uncharacterized protein LOC124811298 [Hydra vulgaris]|uniref:uncharacterized protein LOC124811298 n=1 Tax=Hydra vulgaris TaxID=6087 RepID=UPI0032EA8378